MDKKVKAAKEALKSRMHEPVINLEEAIRDYKENPDTELDDFTKGAIKEFEKNKNRGDDNE